MLRSELVTHVRANLGNRNNLDESLVIDWINWSMRDLAEMNNWDCMKREVVVKTHEGQLSYNPDARIRDIMSCRFDDESNSKRLKFMPYREFDTCFPHPEQDGQGFPDFYTYDGSILKTYPIPSESKRLILWCSLYPEEMDNETDNEVPMPGLEPVIVALSSVYGATTLGDWDKMAVFEAMAKRMIRRKATANTHPSDYSPRYASVPDHRAYRPANTLIVPPV